MQTVKAALVSALISLAPAVRAEAPSFKTPSSNILCYVPDDLPGYENSDQLICLVFSADWAPPLDPACGVDETPTFTLGPTGNAREDVSCHGDVFWPYPTPELGYGSTWSVLNYRCEIETTGVKCVNADGHGFQLARGKRSVF
ncbi:DUF6636 domain-containing protein [Halovulum sp. GXIMD14793]